MGPSRLFTSAKLGTHTLPNRIVMAPMTRLRAIDGMANSTMADYYSQRATAGLIVTECTMISDTSAAYINAPGIYADKHIDGWRAVTDAVHEREGRIFLQLWHSGRVAHSSMMPNGQAPLAPSPIAGVGELHTYSGKQPLSLPRTLSADEIKGLTKAFGKAAERARRAGFDGVEIHGAFGYLVDQFLRDGSNRRDDEFGGSVTNRARFLMGVINAAQQSFGLDVGVKLSPCSRAHGMTDSSPQSTFGAVLGMLSEVDLAYIHMMEPLQGDDEGGLAISDVSQFARKHYGSTLIANGGFDVTSAEAALAAGIADFVSFGTAFIANPDLPDRLQRSLPLSMPDFDKVYGMPGSPLEVGYSDYAVAS
jgi:N-ethylmaleimide reductase